MTGKTKPEEPQSDPTPDGNAANGLPVLPDWLTTDDAAPASAAQASDLPEWLNQDLPPIAGPQLPTEVLPWEAPPAVSALYPHF